MKMKKDFDCVQMKWDIQKRMFEEFSGMTDKERNKILFERLINNPLLSKYAAVFKWNPNDV
jgi:hypothetical protein